MKHVQPGDILTEEQLDAVVKLLNEETDAIQLTTKLKFYFSQFRDELEAKGVLPEYLAYAIVGAQITGKFNPEAEVSLVNPRWDLN